MTFLNSIGISREKDPRLLLKLNSNSKFSYCERVLIYIVIGIEVLAMVIYSWIKNDAASLVAIFFIAFWIWLDPSDDCIMQMMKGHNKNNTDSKGRRETCSPQEKEIKSKIH